MQGGIIQTNVQEHQTVGEVQSQEERGGRGKPQSEQREDALPRLALYSGGQLRAQPVALLWGNNMDFPQAIAQKGFDERHAYIGGMFG